MPQSAFETTNEEIVARNPDVILTPLWPNAGEGEVTIVDEIYLGLSKIKGVEVVGPAFTSERRAPTVSFTMEGMNPIEVCRLLDRRGICAWDGHFYAVRPIEVLGLLEKGGVTRVGVSLYNTSEEVKRLLEAVSDIAGGRLRGD